MGKKYLDTKQNTLEAAVMKVWQVAAEELDPVDPKEAKKKFKDRKDKDIDNDGDTDSTDKYLHKRRKAISKAIEKEDTKKEDHTPAQDTVKGKGSSKDKKPMAKYEETDSPLYAQVKKLLRNK